MFGLSWILGIFFVVIMTIFRYILAKNSQRYHNLLQLFTWDSEVYGAEAASIMGQLVGITWLILGVLFDKVIKFPQNTSRDILEQVVFYGPFLLYGSLLSSRIRKQN